MTVHFRKLLAGLFLVSAIPAIAQDTNALEQAAINIPIEKTVTTEHQVDIRGDSVEYTATTGTQPVWDEHGNAIATLFFTYYKRSDVDDNAKRPLVISFNGGPGSGSLWMHLAYTGPKTLKINDEGYPVQPFGYQDNPYSLLDVADIVYVNPVNTGYSRVLPDKDGKYPSKEQQQKKFFGVNADINYLSDWINTFVTRYQRWTSPKFLIGESYGTTRVSGLAKAMQQRHWMFFNGVILVSPTDLGIRRDGPVKQANRLPYFAATAWYHKQLAPELQKLPLQQLLQQVEQFTVEQYLPALALGSALPQQRKQQLIAEVAKYSGLSEQSVAANHLRISPQFFWKDLLREQDRTIGRLDSRYLGIDAKRSGDSPDYNAELSAWEQAFAPAMNDYVRRELQFSTDVKYQVFGPVHPWDRSNNHVGENLRSAMAENPYLQVMIQSGYFDGATNYFDAKYSLRHIDPSGQLDNRLQFHGYQSGHMMYLRREDLQKANEALREFILQAIPKSGQAAQYSIKTGQ
ncbi:carboxypeptidase [Idiomarina tyrosinivorans]|uniref:Carboxypeptidase n=1 Tax=Idiomarina tyrosinivorans TaxID=1445662 RepID=A0A432ZLP6_9GAMM|nr:carboxypeptidase [Idiomarina tyrosinivorans]RUO78843.1 carboxypeptidase [Idiomarina tyrosinivorans]